MLLSQRFLRALLGAVSLAFVGLASASASVDVGLPKIPDRDFRITDFGAVSDAKTSNTAAFAAAIAAAAEKGGGRVVVPAGHWLTGPITLKSRINLHLEKGALIQFSRDRNDYALIESFWEGKKAWRCESPITGTNLEDVAITGSGIINGSGEVWRPVKKDKLTEGQWKALVSSGGVTDKDKRIWYPSEGSLLGNIDKAARAATDKAGIERIRDSLRPVMISLIECKRVLLEGVSFQNSPAWCVHPLMCRDLTVRGVEVKNPWYAQNGDAIDVESCKNVLIEDSLFDAGDDAICLKSGRDEEGRRRGRPTENVLVRNCVVYHGHGGFVVGSEMSGGVKDVIVENCSFIGTDVGLRFKSTRGRGGVVENIRISNIRMIDISEQAILFDLFYGGKANREEVMPVTEATPAFKHIHISNVTCSDARRAGLFQGLPEMPIQDVTVENCHLVAEEGVLVNNAVGVRFKDVEVSSKKGPDFLVRNSQKVSILNPTFASRVKVEGAKVSEFSLSVKPGSAPAEIGAEVPASAVTPSKP